MRKLSLLAVFITLLSIGSFASTPYFHITNSTSSPLWVYDFDYGDPKQTFPVTGGGPLAAGKTLEITMQVPAKPQVAGRRIYFSQQRLSNSLERNGSNNLPAGAPDAFTPWYDGNVMCSFAEYNYEPNNNRYTVDISYIEAFSYPITIEFTGSITYAGVQKDFEYGFTTFSSAKTQLEAQPNFGKSPPYNVNPWEDLIWPSNGKAPKYNWPPGIYRIIGPLKPWMSQACGNGTLSSYAPTSYQTFVGVLSYQGKELFTTTSNYNGWNQLTSQPISTGYVKALHAAAKPDKAGRYGFMCFPKDEIYGQFTWVPDAMQCSMVIYPYNK